MQRSPRVRKRRRLGGGTAAVDNCTRFLRNRSARRRAPPRVEAEDLAGSRRTLEEFAEKLEGGVLVAVNAADDERGIEGDYWLALLLGGAFVCPVNLVHATDDFEAGWLVVHVKWYSLKCKPTGLHFVTCEEQIVPVNAIW